MGNHVRFSRHATSFLWCTVNTQLTSRKKICSLFKFKRPLQYTKKFYNHANRLQYRRRKMKRQGFTKEPPLSGVENQYNATVVSLSAAQRKNDFIVSNFNSTLFCLVCPEISQKQDHCLIIPNHPENFAAHQIFNPEIPHLNLPKNFGCPPPNAPRREPQLEPPKNANEQTKQLKGVRRWSAQWKY